MKKSLLITSLLATSFLACGVAAMNNVSAKAETADFATAFGASVRVSDPNGIRFKLQLSEEKKNEIFAENSGKELGMYILLGSKAGTDYSALTQKIELEFEEKDLYKEGNAWYANGVMTNLYVQSFNKEFVGVGYIATTTAEGTTYEYSAFNAADNVRSMSGVAIEAYKAEDNQDAMVALIEKAAYAEYGVVETRTTAEGVINYTFAKGEDSWTSYAAMQEAIPVSIAVTEGDLLVGETLDLGAALSINGTKLTKLDVPFTYAVEGEAVTLKDGVVTATGAGEANVTVSFGEWSKTVAVNVQEAANVVFNPASSTASAQVTNNWVFDDANGIRTFVSDEANPNATYGGAYIHLKTTATATKKYWGNVFVKPAHEMSAYEGYDAVSAWIYVESTKGETINAAFLGGDLDLSRNVTTNKWVQVTIPMDKFMARGDGSLYFSSIEYTATVKAIAIGEITAINYEDLPETLVFDTAMGNLQQIGFVDQTAGVYTNALKHFVTEIENADKTYGGAYLRIAPNTNSTRKYGILNVAPILGVNAYSEYTHVKMWFYVETGKNTSTNVTICGTTQAVSTNQWLSVDIPVETFISTNTFTVTWYNDGNWGITGIRIGEITAFKEEVSTKVFVFNPASADAASQVEYGTNCNVFKNATKTFVSAESNTDETYGGAYLRAVATTLSSSKTETGNVIITPLNSIETYAEYTSIKVWVYVESNSDSAKTVFICGQSYADVAANQWVQLEISTQTAIAAGAQLIIGTSYRTNAWAATGMRIGEITAVK